jgi:NADH dehydrogenase
VLVEMAERVLPTFPPQLSVRAGRGLERLGVTPLTGRKVVAIDRDSVTVADPDDQDSERIPARTVVWAAGVVASGLARELAAESGAELDRAGRLTVGPDLTLAGHPEVIALGDMVRVSDASGRPTPLPGLAPVAMQQGRYAARAIRDRVRGTTPSPFRYRDKGNLATIGRSKAVADIKGMHLSGLIAWLAWLVVHIFYLIGFQNRLLVLIRWTFSFVTRGRGARLITAPAEPQHLEVDEPSRTRAEIRR